LRPVTFAYNATNEPNLGLIAEDVQAIEPRLVAFDPSSGLAQSVKYDELAAVLAAVVKDHQQRFDQLTADQPAPWFVAAVGKAIALPTNLTAQHISVVTDIDAQGTVHGHTASASDQLCIDDVCMTKDDLRAFLASRAASSSTPGQGSSATSTASTTPALSAAGQADTEPPTLTIQGNNPATVTVGDE